jgi:hypothetical protein
LENTVKNLIEPPEKLLQVSERKAFVFSKSGGTGKVAAGFQRISEKLALKGFTIGFFSYAGFNT